MIQSPLERVANYPMKIGSNLNFEEWTRTANSSSTNLRKAKVYISIRSKVMSQLLTVFYRVFVNFLLCKIFFKLSLLMFSMMANQLAMLFLLQQNSFSIKIILFVIVRYCFHTLLHWPVMAACLVQQ